MQGHRRQRPRYVPARWEDARPPVVTAVFCPRKGDEQEATSSSGCPLSSQGRRMQGHWWQRPPLVLVREKNVRLLAATAALRFL